MNKFWAWIGGIGGLIVILGAMVWGIPPYLKSTVSDLYAAEAAAAPPPTIPAAVVENTAAVKALGEQLGSMDARMIARDQLQAERDAVIMQYFADKAGGN